MAGPQAHSRIARIRGFAGRHYVTIMFVICTFSPLLRRIADYETGYHKLSPFALLPTLSFLPGFFLLRRWWGQLGAGFRLVCTVWLIAFGFSYLVAFASGSMIPALFTLLQFVTPIGIAGTLVLASPDYRVAFHRSAFGLLVCATISSLYAIFQYVSPPPWDVLWVQNANIISMGEPVPFGLRVFGTYNSDGPFGMFLAMALLLNLPRLSLRRWLTVLMYAPCIIALLLTEVRAAWIAIALGMLLYLVLSPSRRGPMLSIVVVFGVFMLAGTALLAVVHDSQLAVNSVTDRFNTFRVLSGDSSVTARQEETADAWREGIKDPLGLGLGAVSISTRISGGTGGGIDNGFLSRLVEMGVMGWLMYLGALTAALLATVSSYLHLRRSPDREARNIAAVAIALQVVLLVEEATFDQHASFTALFFWYSLFISGVAASEAINARAGRDPASLYAPSRTIRPLRA